MISIVNRRTAGEVRNGTVRIYVGRPSPLGNPFVIGRDGDRDGVIKKYRDWMIGELRREEPSVIDELLRIEALGKKGTVELECWCAPLRCHAEVIKEVIQNWHVME